MGHLTTKDAYLQLEDRLNLFVQGAPSSETLYKILGVLFTEKEARYVSQLPPIKQAMASKQFKSIYLDRLLSINSKKSK